MARNFSALQQRHVVLLGQLEHARVELDPRELAVVVEPRVVEIAGAGLGGGPRLGRRDLADRLLLSHRCRVGERYGSRRVGAVVRR